MRRPYIKGISGSGVSYIYHIKESGISICLDKITTDLLSRLALVKEALFKTTYIKH